MKLVEKFEKNIEGSDYVVGDIHGCFRLLDKKLIDIGFNYDKDRLFCTGDLVDRHEDSIEFWDYLNKPWFHSVLGNHELMTMDAFHEGPMSQSSSMHIMNGGSWFHGLPSIEQQCYVAVMEEMMPLAIEIETDDGLVGIVHADVPQSDWGLFKSMYTDNDHYFTQIATWSRQRIRGGWTDKVKGVEKVYVGHSVVDEITTLGNVTYLDLGMVFTGKIGVVRIQ